MGLLTSGINFQDFISPSFDDFDNADIKGFDHNHFSFDSIYGITENLYVFADTYEHLVLLIPSIFTANLSLHFVENLIQ